MIVEAGWSANLLSLVRLNEIFGFDGDDSNTDPHERRCGRSRRFVDTSSVSDRRQLNGFGRCGVREFRNRGFTLHTVAWVGCTEARASADLKWLCSGTKSSDPHGGWGFDNMRLLALNHGVKHYLGEFAVDIAHVSVQNVDLSSGDVLWL